MCCHGIGQCHLNLSPLGLVARGRRGADASNISRMEAQVFGPCLSSILDDFDVEVLSVWLREVKDVSLELIEIVGMVLQWSAVA